MHCSEHIYIYIDYICDGLSFREKIVIPKSKPYITFVGSSGDPPIITGNDTAATRGSNGMPLKTFHSATVAVNADYFVAANIRFEACSTSTPFRYTRKTCLFF